MIVLTVLTAVCACVLLLPTVSDLISLVRATRRRSERPRSAPPARPAPPGTLPRLLVLVPAHNEELVLASCLGSLALQRYPTERLTTVVVADNCSDRTAAIARGAGVRCLERHAPAEPGKPRAIAWALHQLPFAEFDAVVIVDADTVVDRDFASALATAAPLGGRVAQPYNDVSNRSENALTRMAAVLSAANHRFAFGLKNRVGLNVPLSAGMCVGTEVLTAHGWNAFSICEDWEMYALLTERGVRIESIPGARIAALEASSLRQGASQRRRWQAGKLTVLARRWRSLVRSDHIGVVQKLDALAELSAVGPAVHLGMVALLAGLALLLQPPGAAALAAALAASLIRPTAYTISALRVDPEPVRALVAFAFLPAYTLWRFGIALSAWKMLGEARWVRTERRPLSDRSP